MRVTWPKEPPAEKRREPILGLPLQVARQSGANRLQQLTDFLPSILNTPTRAEEPIVRPWTMLKNTVASLNAARCIDKCVVELQATRETSGRTGNEQAMSSACSFSLFSRVYLLSPVADVLDLIYAVHLAGDRWTVIDKISRKVFPSVESAHCMKSFQRSPRLSSSYSMILYEFSNDYGSSMSTHVH